MSTTVNNTPGTSNPDPAMLTAEAVIAQLRTMRSQITNVAPLSKEQRKLVQRRLRVLEGHVLYDNTPMLRLLRTSGQPLEVCWDGGGVLSVQLAVPR